MCVSLCVCVCVYVGVMCEQVCCSCALWMHMQWQDTYKAAVHMAFAPHNPLAWRSPSVHSAAENTNEA